MGYLRGWQLVAAVVLFLAAGAASGLALGLAGLPLAAIVVAAFLVVLAWRFPRPAVLSTLFIASSAPIGLVWEISPGLPLVTVTRVSIAIALVASILGVATGTVTVRSWVLWPAFLVWFIAVGASIPGSIDVPASRLRLFAEILEIGVICALTYVHFDKHTWRQVIVVLVGATTLNALIALIELSGLHPMESLHSRALLIDRGNPLVSSGDMRFGIVRIQGTFSHPAFLASVLAMVLPITYSLGLVERSRRGLSITAALIMSVALGATATRASWIACFLALVIVTVTAFIQRRQIGPVLWWLSALVSVVLVAVPSVLTSVADFAKELLTTEGSRSTSTTGYRFLLHEEVFAAWTSRPWLGYGAGTFDRLGLSAVRDGLLVNLSSPDSHLLRLVAEVGAIGTLVFAGTVTMGVGSVINSTRRAGPDDKFLLISVVAGLGAYIAVNLTVSAFAIFQTACVFWALIGAGASAVIDSRVPPEPKTGTLVQAQM